MDRTMSGEGNRRRKAAKKRIGVVTSGGDCPGLNAAIRGVGKTAIRMYGMDVIGFVNGFNGLVNGEYVQLSEEMLSGILTLGGTILGTSREKPFAASGDPEGPRNRSGSWLPSQRSGSTAWSVSAATAR